ncbi:hypothetical protein EWM64_g10558 [Hericium alpestre]|uniref:DUF5648 domain-containing protein n=1 Tax=Hericium alpestre TaxID=135208 RepID=A0A4Y9ZGA8_9AGAM|nr:hypothetical protein EWM64_g10558 [Hericium alpestre]
MKFFIALIAALFSLSQAAASPVEAHDALEVRAAACGDPNAAVPLLRAYTARGTDHFYTTSATEMESAIAHSDNGPYVSEGNAALVFTTQVDSTAPLYRLDNPNTIDHFYTTSASERDMAVENDGYNYEEIAAYVYPSQICGSVPFLRAWSVPMTDHFYTTSATEMAAAVADDSYVQENNAGYVLPA